jgi:hypothetical protein
MLSRIREKLWFSRLTREALTVRFDQADFEWSAVEPLLPNTARSARVDDRRCSWHRLAAKHGGRRDQGVSAAEPRRSGTQLFPRLSSFDVMKMSMRRA